MRKVSGSFYPALALTLGLRLAGGNILSVAAEESI
jgi:hypothetical protein